MVGINVDAGETYQNVASSVTGGSSTRDAGAIDVGVPVEQVERHATPALIETAS